MWTKSGIESEGQYAFSCELLRTLRFIYEIQTSDAHPWRKTMENILQTFLLDFKSVRRPKEVEILFGLLRGCDFNGLASYMSAVTVQKERLCILGFVNKEWLSRSVADSQDKMKVYEEFSQKDLKVLALLYNEKNKSRCEFQLYSPNDIRLVSEPIARPSINPSLPDQEFPDKQFKYTSEILNKLLQESDLLSSIDEEDIGSKQLDIFQLSTRTMIMKMINFQLQNNTEHFLKILRESEFYSALLKFVCKEASIEMKGEIMLLEWLEQRCFAIRKYACENQQSLLKQREVHMTIVKDKLYVSYQHPSMKSEKQLIGTELISAINFKNIDEKTEVKLVQASDVFVNNEQAQTLKQVVLLEPESFTQGQGLDIMNAGQGAITYGMDLNKLVKLMFLKQREDRDKYCDIASKTVYLLSEQDFKRIQQSLSTSTFKRSSTVKPQLDDSLTQVLEENFDVSVAAEMINYGGFSPFIANKTIEKEGVETKAAQLVQLAKQVKDGQIEVDESQQLMIPQGMQLQQQTSKLTELMSVSPEKGAEKTKRSEERSEVLLFLKNSFQQTLERAHSDQADKSSQDALFDAINTFSKKDLASEYEKSLIRLFNMYCRQVFWSLIQKDDIEKIFDMTLETQTQMRSFAVFLKVVGNECFVTENKVYIKSYRQFLRKVVSVCCKLARFRPLLKIMVEEGIIKAYQSLIEDLKNDKNEASTRRIEETFKTESKASQLTNPQIIYVLLEQIVKEDFGVVEDCVDNLVSTLFSVYCVFIGNYKLKNKLLSLIVMILEQVRARLTHLKPELISSLLSLKIIEHLLYNFEEMTSYDKEESAYVRRVFKDNPGSTSDIDNIPRKEVERLVYAKKAMISLYYLQSNSKGDTHKILIELLYKLYLIDMQRAQDGRFFYKNNLMVQMQLYEKIMEEGKEGKLNQYMLFYNKLEDSNKIITTVIETNHKEYEGGFTSKIHIPQSSKLLFKVNDSSKLRLGAHIMVSTDQAGRDPLAIMNEQSIKKEQAMKNIYGDTLYFHYPVYPSVLYAVSTNEENPQIVSAEFGSGALFEEIDRFEEQSFGKFYVTKDQKVFIYKNEELRRYKDHLDIQQVTFGKQNRVFLLKSGKVIGEGRNKCKHFIDNEGEQIETKGVEIPFYEKKDRIQQISTFFQMTLAVTEKGKVFACGDKIAKILKLEKQKFGFFEVPLFDEKAEAEILEEEKKALTQQSKKQEKEEVKEIAKSEEKKVEEEVKLVEEKKDEPKEEKKEEEVKQFEEIVAVEEKNGDLVNQVVNIEVHAQNYVPPVEPVLVEEAAPSIAEEQQQEEIQLEEIQPVIEEQKQEEQKIGVPEEEPILEQPIEDPIQMQQVQEAILNEELPPEIPVLGQEQQIAVEQIPPVVQPVDQIVQQEQIVEEEKQQESAPPEEEPVQINTDSKDKSTALDIKAIKVWCLKTSAADQAFLVLVVDNQTNETHLRTFGKSQFGLLGQGKNRIESSVFKRIQFERQVLSPNHVFVGHDHVLVQSDKEDQKIFAWGCYARESEEKALYKATHLPFFDQYDVLKLSSSSRTVALVSHQDTPDKKVIVVGKFFPLWTENAYKTISIFQDLNVYNIQPYGENLFVSTSGSYKFRKALPESNQHKQICEICSLPVTGILHFFKDKEAAFHFFCPECASTGKMTEKYAVDLMFAIKRPVKDLETKPWPEYNTDSLLVEGDARGTAQYVTKYKINGKDFEHYLSLEEISSPSQNDMNPLIYLRLSKPMNSDSTLDPIDLSQFYEQTSHYGLSINITPDYSIQESKELIEKNQAAYDEFKKSLEEIASLSDELKKEFHSKIEEFVTKQAKDMSFHEIKWKELKFGEEGGSLKFNHDQLNELSEECKRNYLGRFVQFCMHVWGSFNYMNRSIKNQGDFSLISAFNKYKQNIPLMVKNKYLKQFVANLGSDDGNSISVHVNRRKAKEFFDKGKVDDKFEQSIFAQVQRGLAVRNYQGMRINQSDKKAWFVKFIGEFALDQGGLFRESLTEMCLELHSHVVNIFVPSQNQKNSIGENRDKWVLNPSLSSPTAHKMLEFIGALIGMSVRSGILITLNLPSFFWKQITEEGLTMADLKGVDQMTVQIMDDLKEVKERITEEQFLQDYELYFTTILSNGDEIPLVPGGKNIRVDYSNLSEFIEKTLNARFAECKAQIKSIKKGINLTFNAPTLRMLSWSDLEYKVVGKEVIEIERLKEITVYRNCQEGHETIKKYWKIMNGLSNEDKNRYLRFVWGRTRLPLKEEEVSESHTIQMDEAADQAKLPIGRTCFFRLEIPPYKSEDQFREKLLYAIRYCTAIDADIDGAVQNEEEQHHPERDQAARQARNDDDDDDGEHEGGDDDNEGQEDVD